MDVILVVLIVILLSGGVGTFPVWHHTADWGYWPSGSAGLLVIIVLAVIVVRGV